MSEINKIMEDIFRLKENAYKPVNLYCSKTALINALNEVPDYNMTDELKQEILNSTRQPVMQLMGIDVYVSNQIDGYIIVSKEVTEPWWMKRENIGNEW